MRDSLAVSQRELDAARDRMRRAMMGRALVLTDAQLDALATVGDADMPTASALWRAANPGALGGLLNAEPMEA